MAAGLAVLLLAGCATGPRGGHASAPDWQDVDYLGAQPVPPPAMAQPNPQPQPTAVPRPAILTETWVPLDRWCASNHFGAPLQIAVAPAPMFALKTPNGVLSLSGGSSVVRWDGVELHLGFPAQVINDRPFLHVLDLSKTVQPLTAGLSFECPGPGVIVIDPGHGGADAGAKSVLGRHWEKDYTLDWALRLTELLAANGWQVRLTRDGDAEVSLLNRVAMAESARADVFISLHFNSAAPNEQQSGVETYCLTPAGMGSTLTRGLPDNPALTFPNNDFDACNFQLALRVHRALLRANDRKDRGIRHARFPAVLRGQRRPAILVEGGYLSNPREAERIADASYRQQLAEAIARALGVPLAGVQEKPAQTAGGLSSTNQDQRH